MIKLMLIVIATLCSSQVWAEGPYPGGTQVMVDRQGRSIRTVLYCTAVGCTLDNNFSYPYKYIHPLVDILETENGVFQRGQEVQETHHDTTIKTIVAIADNGMFLLNGVEMWYHYSEIRHIYR